MEIKVERGVEIPQFEHRVSPDRVQMREAVKALEVGESFQFPATFFQLVYEVGRVCGYHLTQRKMGNGLARVWRLK